MKNEEVTYGMKCIRCKKAFDGADGQSVMVQTHEHQEETGHFAYREMKLDD